MDCATGRTEHLFGHPHGVNYLSASGSDLMMSVYSANGYRPARIPFQLLKGRPVKGIKAIDEPVTDIIQRGDGEFPIDFEYGKDEFSVQRYSKAANLFRLHSWSPLFVNPDAYQIGPGIVLMSQNDLGTLTGWAGYEWLKTDRTNNLLASLRYNGFYPALQLDLASKHFTGAGDLSAGLRPEGYSYGYRQSARLSTSLPLRFSSGAWSRSLEPGAFFETARTASPGVAPLTDRNARLAGLSLNASVVSNLSYRDLFPKWGISFRGSWFTYYRDDSRSKNLTSRLLIYLPGLLSNSSFRVLNSMNRISPIDYPDAVLDFPRGQIVRQAQSSYNLKLDYALPLSYPDYHLTWLIYIKRIKADLFFDAGTPVPEIKWFMSAGLDITFDYNLLRTGIDMESGFRLMYFPTTRKPGFEFLYSFAVN
jgi:hypothetical protein